MSNIYKNSSVISNSSKILKAYFLLLLVKIYFSQSIEFKIVFNLISLEKYFSTLTL